MRAEAEERAALERRSNFVRSIPEGLRLEEDSLPGALASANASARSKLRRIYRVADELGAVREPFVACAKGCSACCHMTVSITSAEAELIGAATGRRPARPAAPPRRDPEAFSGHPCPFLAGGRCSIYEHRPLVCRKHSSFFPDASRCQPEVMNSARVPQLSFSGLDQALFEVSAMRQGLVLADIRDFFPPAGTEPAP